MEAPHEARTRSRSGRLAPLLEPAEPALRLGISAFVVVAGGILVRDATATPSTEWMFLFRLSDFETGGDALAFFRHLHTGIPPFLAAVEIGLQLLLHDAGFVEGPLFRLALVAVFVLPVAAFARTRLHVLACGAVSPIFVWAIAFRDAPWRDWNYAVFFPLFILLALALANRARTSRRHGSPAPWLCFGVGTCLAMAELSRPFMLLMLPFVGVCLYSSLRPWSRRSAFALLVPLVVLSGGWHAKLLWHHEGQVLWSNNGGFNVYRGWKDRVDEWPAFAGEPGWLLELAADQPVRGTGKYRFLNWNSKAHSEKSAALGRAALAFVLRHPLESAHHVAGRVVRLLWPKAQHEGLIAWLYAAALPLSAAWLLSNGVWLGVRSVRERGLAPLEHVDAGVVVSGILVLLLVAAGESGEEARLVTHTLPFLACLPSVFGSGASA